MKRIVLFRFHKKPLVCRNHLNLLKKFNPNINIYGLYGGPPENISIMRRYLNPDLNHIYHLDEKTDSWKWQNSDLAVREWYLNYGQSIAFDLLHLIEWDLLLFDSLEKIYRHIPPNHLGLTGLKPLSEVEAKWDWTTEEPEKTKWLRFKTKIAHDFGLPSSIQVCLGPGPLLPHQFIDKYSHLHLSTLVHDEIRLPIMAKILGFLLTDTGFYKDWFNDQERQYFNCINKDIDENLIRQELIKPTGRRVFHPFRKIISNSTL